MWLCLPVALTYQRSSHRGLLHGAPRLEAQDQHQSSFVLLTCSFDLSEALFLSREWAELSACSRTSKSELINRVWHRKLGCY